MTTAETTEPAPAPAPAPERPSLGPVGTAADLYIRPLQKAYRDDLSYAVAALARLRRGAGKPANAVPDLWGQTGTEQLAAELGRRAADEPAHLDFDRAEEALHLAVTLWALHQQSHREHNMHATGHGLGRAVRDLMRAVSPGSAATGSGASTVQDLDEPIRRRFVRTGNANTLDTLAVRCREITQLLRAHGIPLDYGLLADQLYQWQDVTRRADVRRAWGRDFHLAATRRKPDADPAPEPSGSGGSGSSGGSGDSPE